MFTGAIPFDVSIQDPRQRLEAYLNRWREAKDYNGFDALLMRTITVHSATASTSSNSSQLAYTTFHLPILPAFYNPIGNMHSGAIALLADIAISIATAPVSQPGW